VAVGFFFVRSNRKDSHYVQDTREPGYSDCSTSWLSNHRGLVPSTDGYVYSTGPTPASGSTQSRCMSFRFSEVHMLIPEGSGTVIREAVSWDHILLIRSPFSFKPIVVPCALVCRHSRIFSNAHNIRFSERSAQK